MSSVNQRPGLLANTLLGCVGVGILVWFVGGLAWSIGKPAFGVIALIVLTMAIVDFIQGVRDSRR